MHDVLEPHPNWSLWTLGFGDSVDRDYLTAAATAGRGRFEYASHEKELEAAFGTVIAPVVICAAIGFLWSRRGEPFDVGQVTRISVTLGTPCLIVWTFEQTRPEPDVFLEIAAAITFAFVALPN